MMKQRTVVIASAGGFLLLLLCVDLLWPRVIGALHHYQAGPLPVPAKFVHIPVLEPSGAAYHTERGTLLVISDEGQLVEMDREFKVLQTHDIPGDPEGVSVHPGTGTVFVAVEYDNAIVEYDLDERRVLRTLVVDLNSHDDFKGKTHENMGFEGVAVVSEGDDVYRLFAVIEARPARLVVLSADVSIQATARARRDSVAAPFVGVKENVNVVASYDVGLTRISDVAFDVETQQMLVIASGARTLTMTDLNGRPLRSIRLPGRKPEGFCFLPNGDAVIAEDTGGVFLCDGLRSALCPETLVMREP